MTIDEIEMKLPNGFHDASLKKIHIDYIKREANLEIDVHIGTPEDKKETYRTVSLKLDGLQFYVIEPPDPQYFLQGTKGHWIADSAPLESLESEKLPKKLIECLPKGAFIHYFFISDWNAFIYLAAMDASFEWAD